MKSIVLLSGGMDSTTVLAYAVKHSRGGRVVALCFDYGSKHAAREQASARAVAAHFGVELIRPVHLPLCAGFAKALTTADLASPQWHYTAPSQKAAVVPFRNGIMLSIAVGFAEEMA